MKKGSNKKLVATIDATPSWESLVQLFIEWIQSGTSEQHQQASESLFQMAKISDTYVKEKKKFELSNDLIVAINKYRGAVGEIEFEPNDDNYLILVEKNMKINDIIWKMESIK